MAYFFCETGGVKLISASEAGAIIGTIPVAVAILAAVVLGERPGFVQGLFILVSPVGVVYLSLLSSVGAFFLVNFMLSRMEAARSVAYTNLTTLVSVLAGVSILRESFHWYQGIGGILILFGVWGTNRFGRPAPVVPMAAGE